MSGPSTVVLVHHAEPQTSGADSGLTAAGKKRAELLGLMFQQAGVTALFTSELRRTKETAQPLAVRLSLEPEVLLGLDTAAHREGANFLSRFVMFPATALLSAWMA